MLLHWYYNLYNGTTMYTLKIRRVGNSQGITLPKELLQKLNVREGDSIFVTETAEGVQLTAYDPEFEKAMAAYRKVSSKYKNALRELA
jgi:putative addiction module antidote